MQRWLPVVLFVTACPLDPLTVVAGSSKGDQGSGTLPLAPLGSQVVVPFSTLDQDSLQAFLNGKPATIVGRSPDRLILQVPTDVVTDQGKAVLDLYQDGKKVLEQMFGVVPGISSQTPQGGFFSPFSLTGGTGTPAPTPQPTAEATPSPMPSPPATSQPSPSPSPSATSQLSPTPTPSATAQPTPSAAPTPVPSGQAEVNAHVDF